MWIILYFCKPFSINNAETSVFGMEVKKSSQADLDSRRTERFLLGLIVVLATLFVALEFDFTLSDSEADYDALSEIVKEIDLEALKEKEDLIPLIQKQVVEIPKSSDKLNIVEDEQPQEELPEETPLDSHVEYKQAEEDEAPTEPVDMEMDNNPQHRRIVEQLPEFPGGATAFMKWLTQNLKYPATAQQRKVQGKVVAQFIVNTDGSISDLKIVESLEASCDREALRVLRMMPAWKAGIENDKPCRTMVAIPIVFKL